MMSATSATDQEAAVGNKVASDWSRRPFLFTLSLAHRTLLFTDLQLNDINLRQEAFRLVTDAARRSDNIGVDEIPSIEYLAWLLSNADDVIAIYDGITSGGRHSLMVGLLVLFPSRYVRSSHPSTCNLLIVTGEPISSRLVWRDLVRIGLQLAFGVQRGYTGCSVDVFVTCYERVIAMREEGLVITAVIPDAGLVTGFPNRHIDSYVMYKELALLPAPLLLTSDCELSPDDGNDLDIPPDDVNLPTIGFLPVRHVLSDGTPIVIRSMSDVSEIANYYSALKAAIASGDGYGVDELPSLAYFIRWYVTDFYNVVYELASPTQANSNEAGPPETLSAATSVIAYANFGPSLFTRSVNNAILSDGNIVILPEFRRRHWSSELQQVQFEISYDVGFRRVFGETSIKNLPSMLSMRRIGVTLTGSIPRGIYFKDVGWTDLVMLHLELVKSYQETRQQPPEDRCKKLMSKI